MDRTVQGRREAGELARNVRPRITSGRPIMDSDIAPQLYQAVPVENREVIPGVRSGGLTTPSQHYVLKKF